MKDVIAAKKSIRTRIEMNSFQVSMDSGPASADFANARWSA
jgi:hypothetical protein